MALRGKRTVDHDLAARLREFFVASRHRLARARQDYVYDLLSPALLGELLLAANERWIVRVPWLGGVSREFLVVLARSMAQIACARMEAPLGRRAPPLAT